MVPENLDFEVPKFDISILISPLNTAVDDVHSSVMYVFVRMISILLDLYVMRFALGFIILIINFCDEYNKIYTSILKRG